MKDVIEDIRSTGTTVFLATHDMTVADQVCDRVAFIVDGQLALVDAPRKLKIEYGEPTVRVEYRTDSTGDTREFPLTGLDTDDEFAVCFKMLESRRFTLRKQHLRTFSSK